MGTSDAPDPAPSAGPSGSPDESPRSTSRRGLDGLRIVIANLQDAVERQTVVDLINAYSRDEMGNHEDLPAAILSVLGDRLAACPSQIVFVAWRQDQPVGIAVCFEAFSTFRAQPLINIHDLAVLPEFRGQGIGKALLAAVEEEARRRGCAKVTLEVLKRNQVARQTYRSVGFGPDDDDDDAMLFFSKSLD